MMYCCDKKCFVAPFVQVDGIACNKCESYCYCRCRCQTYRDENSTIVLFSSYDLLLKNIICIARNIEEAKERLENLNSIVDQYHDMYDLQESTRHFEIIKCLNLNTFIDQERIDLIFKDYKIRRNFYKISISDVHKKVSKLLKT